MDMKQFDVMLYSRNDDGQLEQTNLRISESSLANARKYVKNHYPEHRIVSITKAARPVDARTL